MVKHQRGGSIVVSHRSKPARVGAGAELCGIQSRFVQLTKAMALELARYKIRANAPARLCGDVYEPRILRHGSRPGPDQRIPQRRLGNPEELDAALPCRLGRRVGNRYGAGDRRGHRTPYDTIRRCTVRRRLTISGSGDSQFLGQFGVPSAAATANTGATVRFHHRKV